MLDTPTHTHTHTLFFFRLVKWFGSLLFFSIHLRWTKNNSYTHTNTHKDTHTHNTLIKWLTVELLCQSSAKVRIDLHIDRRSSLLVCVRVGVCKRASVCVQSHVFSVAIHTHINIATCMHTHTCPLCTRTHSPVAWLCATGSCYHGDDELTVNHHDRVMAQWEVKDHWWWGLWCVSVWGLFPGSELTFCGLQSFASLLFFFFFLQESAN